MYCKYCGREINDDAIFCPYCGLGVVQEDNTHCPVCGSEIIPDAKFCTKCGTELDNNGSQGPTSFYTSNANVPKQAETPTIGILSIVFGALGGWLGLLFAIIGLCTYKRQENRTKCYIGLGLFCAWILVVIILIATAGI